MAPLFLVFLLSGFSGLVFEVLWVRLAALGLGVTVYAVSTVLSAFMGGLALGGWLAGRYGDRRGWGVRTYACLELGIALSGLVTTALLKALPFIAGDFLILLAGLSILIPCTLMGATIPVLSRAVFDPARPGRVVGWLYATNTLGAMLGAFCTDMMLVPQLGIWNSACLAACLNLTAGLVSFLLPERRSPGPRKLVEEVRGLTPLYWAYALSGGTALALQVVWVRLLGVAVDAKIWVFSMILTTFLGCMAIGSWVGSSFVVGTLKKPRAVLAALFVIIALSSLAGSLTVAVLEPYLWRPPISQWLWLVVRPIGPELGWGIVLCLTRALVLFAVPTFLMGLAFPLTCQAALEERSGISEPIGRLYTVNTLGAIVGSLLAGFWLLPLLGVQRSLGALALSSLASAALVQKRRGWLMVGLLGTLLYLTLPKDWLVRRFHFPVYLRAYGIRAEEVVDFREDFYGTVAVAKGTDVGDVLLVNRTMMMGSGVGGRRYSRMMAHLPLTLHPRPRKMLVICFGLGMTFGAASLHNELESLRCVELSPSVLKVAPYFKEFNENIMERLGPTVQVTVADGRNFQLRSQEKFDVISFEPPPPNSPGVVNLYSADYYQLCKQHLTPDGVICQWLPIKQFSEPTGRMVTRTFLEVFPQSTLWEGSLDDYFIVGSLQPLHCDISRLREFSRRFERQLEEIGFGDLYDLLAAFKMGPLGLQRYSAGGKLVSDNYPYLEYVSSLSPPVEEMRRSDLSELTSLVSGLNAADVERTRVRATALAFLHSFANGSRGFGDDISPCLLQYRWARACQGVYPANAYVEDVLRCGPRQLATLRRHLDGRPIPLEDLAFGQLLARDGKGLSQSLSRLKHDFPERPLGYFLQGLADREAGQATSAFDEGLNRIADPRLRAALTELLP